MKNKMYAITKDGYQHNNPRKKIVTPTKPIDAGMPNERTRLRTTTGMRIHQIGMIGAPQNGQLRYGRLFSVLLGLRSCKQLGQEDQGFFIFRGWRTLPVIFILTSEHRWIIPLQYVNVE